MSDQAAYLPETTNPDSWGTIFVNDAEDFNIRNAVAASVELDKTFVVSDPAVIRSLDIYVEMFGTLAKVAVPGG